MPNLKDQIGFTHSGPAIASPDEENRLREFVNLKLAARGCAIVGNEEDFPFLDLGRSLIANFQEKTRLLSDYLCPVDAAIDDFLHAYLGEEIVAEGVSRTASTWCRSARWWRSATASPACFRCRPIRMSSNPRS